MGSPQGAAGAAQDKSENGRLPPPAGPDACVCYHGDERYACRNDDQTIMDFAAWCAIADPCPATLDVWRRCSSSGSLGSPGRQGYLRAQCGAGHTAVYYIYGFGDYTYWLYDEGGALVGRGMSNDAGGGVECGVARAGCVFPLVAAAGTERLSPAAQDGGASGELPAECTGLGPGDGAPW